jgi:hypothetical protein
MRSFIFIILFQILAGMLWAQNNIAGYEFWFNNAIEQRTKIDAFTNDLDITIDTQHLSDGLHTVHLRCFDSEMFFSAPITGFFFKKGNSLISSASIVAYRYWFNNNLQQMQTENISPLSSVDFNLNIDTQHLPEGINSICLQVKDNMGQWSGVLTQNFLKTGGNFISKYQYWFNDRFDALKEYTFEPNALGTTNIAIDASKINNGLNTVHVRYLDNFGKWSSTLSQFFIKTSSNDLSNRHIAMVQYWFNNEFEQAISTMTDVQSKAFELNGIDLSHLADGLHTMHIRFIDNNGLSTHAESVYILKQAHADQHMQGLTAFEYWFDNDFGNRYTELIPNSPIILNHDYWIDFGQQQMGTRRLSFRYVDSKGLWSVVSTSDVYHWPVATQTHEFENNRLKVYPVPANEFIFVEMLDAKPQNTIELIDINGKVLQMFFSNNSKEKIDVSSLLPGLYLLRVSGDSDSQTIRFLKK